MIMMTCTSDKTALNAIGQVEDGDDNDGEDGDGGRLDEARRLRKASRALVYTHHRFASKRQTEGKTTIVFGRVVRVRGMQCAFVVIQ